MANAQKKTTQKSTAKKGAGKSKPTQAATSKPSAAAQSSPVPPPAATSSKPTTTTVADKGSGSTIKMVLAIVGILVLAIVVGVCGNRLSGGGDTIKVSELLPENWEKPDSFKMVEDPSGMPVLRASYVKDTDYVPPHEFKELVGGILVPTPPDDKRPILGPDAETPPFRLPEEFNTTHRWEVLNDPGVAGRYRANVATGRFHVLMPISSAPPAPSVSGGKG